MADVEGGVRRLCRQCGRGGARRDGVQAAEATTRLATATAAQVRGGGVRGQLEVTTRGQHGAAGSTGGC